MTSVAEAAPGSSTTPGPDVHVTRRRIFATLIDGLLLGVVSWALTGIFGTGAQGTAGAAGTGLSTTGSLAMLVVTVLYFVLMEGLLGRTVGKYATGIKVVDEATGAVPGAGKAFLRTLLRIVDGFFAYLVAFIVVQTSKRRQRLGDMAAKTLVVRA